MTTKEVAEKLVQLCRENKFREAADELYSPEIVSIEPFPGPDGSRETKGKAAVDEKANWWIQNHEVHSSAVEGPLVAGVHFSVTFKMEVTFKPDQSKKYFEEIGVYKVSDGKIVSEEFFYSM